MAAWPLTGWPPSPQPANASALEAPYEVAEPIANMMLTYDWWKATLLPSRIA